MQIDLEQQSAPPRYIDEGDEWERGLAQTYSTLNFDHIEVSTEERRSFDSGANIKLLSAGHSRRSAYSRRGLKIDRKGVRIRAAVPHAPFLGTSSAQQRREEFELYQKTTASRSAASQTNR